MFAANWIPLCQIYLLLIGEQLKIPKTKFMDFWCFLLLSNPNSLLYSHLSLQQMELQGSEKVAAERSFHHDSERPRRLLRVKLCLHGTPAGLSDGHQPVRWK